MEPDERLTKRERREKARRERREQELVQQRTSRRRRITTIAGTVLGIAAVAALIWVTAEPAPESSIVLSRAEAEQAHASAGCEEPEIAPPASTAHLSEPAPPADQLYPDRPTHSGPHFANVHPVGVFDDPIDERMTTHNLEHGAIVVWYDQEQVADDDVTAMEEWARERNRAGFQGRGGAGIIVSPFETPLDSGKAVALRAWNVATDCDSFDEAVGDAFVIENYGTAGQAPERQFAPYPEGVLQFGDGARQDQPQDTEGSPGDDTGEQPSGDESPAGGEGEAEEAPADEESPAEDATEG